MGTVSAGSPFSYADWAAIHGLGAWDALLRGRMGSRHLGGSGRAVAPRPPLTRSRPPTALRRMAKLSTCHWLNAQQFCRARPVRAPKAAHWRSAWQSASKNGAATGTVRERIALSLTFHIQWLVKGSCSRNKPFTCDSFAFDDERLGDSRKAFSHRACGRQPLWKRLAMCEAIHQLWCAHGARTAKLLRTSQRPSQCDAFGGSDSACRGRSRCG